MDLSVASTLHGIKITAEQGLKSATGTEVNVAFFGIIPNQSCTRAKNAVV